MNAALIMTFKHETASKNSRTLLEIPATSRPPRYIHSCLSTIMNIFVSFLSYTSYHLNDFFQRYMASLCTDGVRVCWSKMETLKRFILDCHEIWCSEYYSLSTSNISPKPNLMLFKTISFISFFSRSLFPETETLLYQEFQLFLDNVEDETKKNLLSLLT